jgi:hypothetical protein
MWLVSLFRSVSGAKEARDDVNEFDKVPIQTEIPKDSESHTDPDMKKQVDPISTLSAPKVDSKGMSSSAGLEKAWKRYLDHSHKDEEEPDYPDCITGEGLMLFAEDLEVDPLDSIMLVLFWKLNAKKQYLFTKDEFVGGFMNEGCTTLDEIKAKLVVYRKLLVNHAEFKKFYVFVFDYSKGFNPNIKSIPIEVAIPTWQTLLKNRYSDLENWCEFIQNQHKKPISRDLWIQFLEFTKEVGDHDDSGSWPVAIDEFCVYKKKK